MICLTASTILRQNSTERASLFVCVCDGNSSSASMFGIPCAFTSKHSLTIPSTRFQNSCFVKPRLFTIWFKLKHTEHISWDLDRISNQEICLGFANLHVLYEARNLKYAFPYRWRARAVHSRTFRVFSCLPSRLHWSFRGTPTEVNVIFDTRKGKFYKFCCMAILERRLIFREALSRQNIQSLVSWDDASKSILWTTKTIFKK